MISKPALRPRTIIRTPDDTPNTGVTQPPAWQKLLAQGVRTVEELCQCLNLTPEALPDIDRTASFPLRVPRGFVAQMRTGDPDDPLLRQILPLARENTLSPGFITDPVGDMAALRRPGLIHKYHGRALIMTTGACAIHCRYCFRRHFPYQAEAPHHEDWGQLLRLIQDDSSLHEIILSGGDPLMIPDQRLSPLVHELLSIPHVLRVRLHTRLPIVLPERIDTSLLKWLGHLGRQAVVVIHCNHPNELASPVRQTLQTMAQCGITLLNQTVLLHGINDQTATLKALSERLFSNGVMPYYLHLLDRVQGAAHFEVDRHRARAIFRELHDTLPGYLVPRLVEEVAGASGKTLISPL